MTTSLKKLQDGPESDPRTSSYRQPIQPRCDARLSILSLPTITMRHRGPVVPIRSCLMSNSAFRAFLF